MPDTVDGYPSLINVNKEPVALVAGEERADTTFTFLAQNFTALQALHKGKEQKWKSTHFWYRGYEWFVSVYPDRKGDHVGKSVAAFLNRVTKEGDPCTLKCRLGAMTPTKPDVRKYVNNMGESTFSGESNRGYNSLIPLEDLKELTHDGALMFVVEMISCDKEGPGHVAYNESNIYGNYYNSQLQFPNIAVDGCGIPFEFDLSFADRNKGTKGTLTVNYKNYNSHCHESPFSYKSTRANIAGQYCQLTRQQQQCSFEFKVSVTKTANDEEVFSISNVPYLFVQATKQIKWGSKLKCALAQGERVKLQVVVLECNITGLLRYDSEQIYEKAFQGHSFSAAAAMQAHTAKEVVFIGTQLKAAAAEAKSAAIKTKVSTDAEKKTLQVLATGLLAKLAEVGAAEGRQAVKDMPRAALDREEAACLQKLEAIRKARNARFDSEIADREAAMQFSRMSPPTKATKPKAVQAAPKGNPLIDPVLLEHVRTVCTESGSREPSVVGAAFQKKHGLKFEAHRNERFPDSAKKKLQHHIDALEFDLDQASPTSSAEEGSPDRAINAAIQARCHVPKEDTDKQNECIDRVADFCRNKLPFSVAKCFLGGSVKKGTALKDQSDVDLVVFINDLPKKGSISSWMPPFLDCLRTAFESSDLNCELKCKVTPFAVCFQIEGINFDVLPCPTMAPVEALAIMEAEPAQRESCSKAMTELQVEYIQERTDEGSRDVIRLVKCFRHWLLKEKAPPSNHSGQPASYLLELVVVHASLNLKDSERSSKRSLIKETLKLLKSARCGVKGVKGVKGNLHLKDGLSWLNTRLETGEKTYRLLPEHEAHNTNMPVVIDPANPYNNVADRMKPVQWKWLVEQCNMETFDEFCN